MGRKRSGKPYRLVEAEGRSIQCIFAHIPGKRFSTGTRDRDEAVQWALDFLRNDGRAADGVPTLEEFAKDFFLRKDPDSIWARFSAFDRGRNPTWASQRQGRLENYILPKFGKYRIDAITPGAIENWMTGIKGVKTEDLANATKNDIVTTLKLILDDAVRKEYIVINPCTQITKFADKRKSERRPLSIHEQEVLFPNSSVQRVAIWGDLRWAVYFSVMYDTGFRPGEVGGLQMGDLYTTPKGMAVFSDREVESHSRKVLDRVKTSGKGAENRVGLLSDITVDLLKAHIVRERLEDPAEFLFRSDKGALLGASCTEAQFKRVIYRQGLDETLIQYSLRHTFLTYRRGRIDDRTLALAMGHSHGPRGDYDHRDAEILIEQLEQKRDEMFQELQESGVIPFCRRKA